MRRFFAASAGLAAGLVVSLVLVTAGGSNVASEVIRPAEQPSVAAPAEPQPAAAAAPQAAATRSGLPTEGIKVHGRWSIQVREPDGALVSSVEFDNALVGGSRLVALLARNSSAGFWTVELAGGGTVGPCGSSGGIFPSPVSCFVSEPGSGTAQLNNFLTLTVTAPTAGENAGKLVLSGTATATAIGAVASVATHLQLCAPNIAPSTPCSGGVGPGTQVTSTTLTTPQSVATGQQIQVTVVISFQ